MFGSTILKITDRPLSLAEKSEETTTMLTQGVSSSTPDRGCEGIVWCHTDILIEQYGRHRICIWLDDSFRFYSLYSATSRVGVFLSIEAYSPSISFQLSNLFSIIFNFSLTTSEFSVLPEYTK